MRSFITTILIAGATTACLAAEPTILSSMGVVKEVYGMGGEIVIDVIVEDSVITAVDVVEHKESYEYFEEVENEGLLKKWNGLTLKEAATAKVDAVSGSTITSNAIIESVKQIANKAIQ